MNDDYKDISSLSKDLQERVQREEKQYGRGAAPTDSLWDHLVRVSRLAERLGRAEGVDPMVCRLAGLFHDAGKFSQGRYHEDERAEEELSVEYLRELGGRHGLDSSLLDHAAGAILQLYRDDPEPAPVAGVLFDADNLDKLGPLGVACYFTKLGLRGRGVSGSSLHNLTVELTYARHAPHCLSTESGRRLARVRASATISFIHDLLNTLRDDGLYHFRVEEVCFEGFTVDVVTPDSCLCGGRLERTLWKEQGFKCSEIHIRHTCAACGESQKLKFCKPRLSSESSY
ncbi:MAG: HD domain-containing protein [Planctomycetota bacterium]